MNTFQYNAYPHPPAVCVKNITKDTLDIDVANGQARRWIFKVAPKFGYFDLYNDAAHRFVLTVHGDYDIDTVKEFLESYVEL